LRNIFEILPLLLLLAIDTLAVLILGPGVRRLGEGPGAAPP
jgi:hypothetical protein